MKIVLTHSYFLRFDPKQWKQQQPYAPLGTLYAASVLQSKGFDVVLYDVMFRKHAAEINEVLILEKPDVLVIYDDGFNYLTKMCLTNMREAAFEMCRIARAHNCKVIVCSSDSTDQYKLYIENGFDFVIQGEGEITLSELVNALKEDGDFKNIPGLIFKSGAEIVRNPKREVLRNLDSIPFPAWRLINMQPYIDAWKNKYGYFSINMSTTRGCPFKCNWCAKPIYGNRYNSRSPQNVIDEILFLKESYPVDHIWFSDDIFGLKPGWIQEFAKLIELNNIKVKFKIQSRADLLLESDTLDCLSKAGCESVWMGAESGSQKILHAMDKGITVEQIYKATSLLKQKHIKACLFLQFGYPGEVIEDIEATIKMVSDLQPDDIGISVSYPLPGTPFYESVKNELVQKANWTDSDELALMFKNTYSPVFYKVLHRYIHRMYRRKSGMRILQSLLSEQRQNNQGTIRTAVATGYHFFFENIYRMRLKKLAPSRINI